MFRSARSKEVSMCVCICRLPSSPSLGPPAPSSCERRRAAAAAPVRCGRGRACGCDQHKHAHARPGSPTRQQKQKACTRSLENEFDRRIDDVNGTNGMLGTSCLPAWLLRSTQNPHRTCTPHQDRTRKRWDRCHYQYHHLLPSSQPPPWPATPRRAWGCCLFVVSDRDDLG